jgi:hypothetical protein
MMVTGIFSWFLMSSSFLTLAYAFLTNTAGHSLGILSPTDAVGMAGSIHEGNYWPTNEVTITSWIQSYAQIGWVVNILTQFDTNYFQPIGMDTIKSYFDGITLDSGIPVEDFFEWRHYAFTWSGVTGIVTYYVDGQPFSTFSDMHLGGGAF